MTTYNNPFFKPTEEYKRDFYPLKHTLHQAGYYLSVMTGATPEVATNWLRNKIKNKELEGFNDPIVEYLLRGENYDRTVVQQPLSKMIQDIIKNKEIMAPSMTTYLNEEVEKSMLAVSIDANIAKRSKAKKEMFKWEAEETMAKARGDEEAEAMFHSNWFFSEKTQAATKISNNSVSGMHNSAANPLFNPSSHSTLTSNCRITSGFGNANNEKLVMGNRHYWSARVTICNIVSIIANSDYEKIGKFVRENNFHIPTAEEVMAVIEYSSNFYWRDSVQRKHIEKLVNKLDDLQRCAFVYTGDLFHVRKFNDQYMRDFIGSLIRKVEDSTPRTAKDMKEIFEDHTIWAHHICAKEWQGRGVDYGKMEGTPELATLHATASNISKTLHDYTSFIDTFLMTDNVPASVPRFPDSIRRCAIISDTDSTIFTAQDWQQWYHGELAFHGEAIAVGATVIALASQSIGHVLALMSKNAGVADHMLRRIAMKNEFYFPVAVPTRVAKHYFAGIYVQEGNVKGEMEYEIKGVHLKSSNAPKFVNDEAKRIMTHIIDTVMAGKKLSMNQILGWVSGMENRVKESLLKGEATFFRRGQIQPLDAYKGKDTPERTNYFQYMIWKEVFAPKYGDIAPPPYGVIKLSTTIDSPTLTQKWLDDMEDQALANRMRDFMKRYGRKNFGTFWLPADYVTQYGLPKEFQDAIGIRHMVAGICKVFYIILETLGYYGLNSKETNLSMDYYNPAAYEPEVKSEYIVQEKVFLEDEEGEEDDSDVGVDFAVE